MSEPESIKIELPDLIQAIDDQNAGLVTDLVDCQSVADSLHHLSILGSEHRGQMFALLSPESAAEIIEQAPDSMAVSLIENLETPVAARIVEELSTDTQADIVQDMDEDTAGAILSHMKDESAEQVRQLAQYDPSTAGGLMDSNVTAFNVNDTVAMVFASMAVSDEDDNLARYRGRHPYVVDESGQLVGVISLRRIITSKRSVRIAELMTAALSVKPQTKLIELEALFAERDFLSVPVVDDQLIPIGVVLREDVNAATLKQSERDSMSMQGVSDELRSMPIWLRSRRRLVWLSSNIGLNIVAASVIASYEETLAAVIAIAIFLPMVSDMSGCSGNQAIGVSMRELALGLVRPSDIFHVLRKELSVGIINGIVLGSLIGLVAWVWKGNAVLGGVIGLALCANTILAVAIGGTVPLVLKGFGVDPAVASGPLLTTVTDIAGFFLVLSLATLFMPYLV